MDAGRLRHIIGIWRNMGAVNSYGEKIDSWQCIDQCRAERTVQNSRRALRSGEIWYPRAAVFKIRLGHDVQEGDRILFEDRYWDVISAPAIDREAEHSITINTELHND